VDNLPDNLPDEASPRELARPPESSRLTGCRAVKVGFKEPRFLGLKKKTKNFKNSEF